MKKLLITHYVLLLLGLVCIVACTPGQSVEEEVPTISPPSSPTAPLATMTVVPTATNKPVEVETVEEVLYATAVDPDAHDQSLNITYLPGSQEKKPVVVWAHGTNLDKSSGRTLAKLLAKQGFVVMPIDWRDTVTAGGDSGSLREAMENGDCVLRFVSSQAEQYGGDPERVIWTGYSAGAWLGSMISFGQGDLQSILDEYAAANDGPEQRTRCTVESEPAEIVGYVPSAGSFPGDFWLDNGENDRWTAIFAPVENFTAIGNNPDLKVRLIHGERDLSVDTSFSAAERFATALQDAGYDVIFLPQSGGHESFQLQIVDEILALTQE